MLNEQEADWAKPLNPAEPGRKTYFCVYERLFQDFTSFVEFTPQKKIYKVLLYFYRKVLNVSVAKVKFANL